jgi:hypothetical protein
MFILIGTPCIDTKGTFHKNSYASFIPEVPFSVPFAILLISSHHKSFVSLTSALL